MPDQHDAVRGTAPSGQDPEVPLVEALPDRDPAWQPSDLAGDLRRRFGRQLTDRPPDRLWFPHLLIRGTPGDSGGRPLWEPVPCWLSPDIHLLPELPPGDPLDLTQAVQSPTIGDRYTVAVHVWNLGRFPAFGVAVRAYWVAPGFFAGSPDPTYGPHFIGGTFIELGDRDSGQAHRVVPIPQPWTVPDVEQRHACLLAVVESFADPWTGVLAPNSDRHVAQRNLVLLQGDEDVGNLLNVLGRRIERGEGLDVQLGHARTPSLRGAVERGLASNDDVSIGRGPVTLARMTPLTRLLRGDGEWLTLRLGEPTGGPVSTGHDDLAPVVVDALGAAGTVATDLLNGSRLAGANRVALHFTTETTGYTIMLAG
ncbi:hypothetical protein ACI8AK_05320 [Geodermatophilus sp. SYSU D00867]